MVEIPVEVIFFFLLTCFHSQVLKFLWYRFDSSAYFKSLLKKRKKITLSTYRSYLQVSALRKQQLKQYPLECLIKPNTHEEKPTIAKQSQNIKHPK